MQQRIAYNSNEVLKDWDFTYNQMSKGQLQCTIEEVTIEDLLLYSEHLNTAAFQMGGCYKNYLNIGFFSNSAIYMGNPVSKFELISLRPEDEILLMTPENSKFHSLSIPLRYFNDEIPIGSQQSTILKMASYQKFSNSLQHLFQYIFTKDTTSINEQHTSEFKRNILDVAYHYAYSMDDCFYKTNVNRNKALKIVKKIIKEVYLNPDIQFTIEELCMISNTSRRSLYYCFEYVTGESPHTFIKFLKLNAVRQKIQQSSPKVKNIHEIAYDWGFWHLSNFSGDYKKLFHELPSQTLNQP